MNIGTWDSDSGEVFVIAEAGVNHCGKSDMALRLIDAAAAAGADAVKFQWFKTEALVTRRGPAAALLRPLELDADVFAALKVHADQIGLTFLCSVFDLESADAYLALDPPAVKIGSGELREYELLRHVTKAGKPLIISTGMATMQDVSAAVTEARNWSPVALLHCVSAYPTPLDQVNLRAMDALKAFHCPVGLSDHTTNLIQVPTAAVARGAVIIEKHLTLDIKAEGPDHAASLNPLGFGIMVKAIRDATLILGHGRKAPMPCEAETMRAIGR